MIYRLRSGREIVMIVSMGLRFHHNIPKVNKKRGQFGPFSVHYHRNMLSYGQKRRSLSFLFAESNRE